MLQAQGIGQEEMHCHHPSWSVLYLTRGISILTSASKYYLVSPCISMPSMLSAQRVITS